MGCGQWGGRALAEGARDPLCPPLTPVTGATTLTTLAVMRLSSGRETFRGRAPHRASPVAPSRSRHLVSAPSRVPPAREPRDLRIARPGRQALASPRVHPGALPAVPDFCGIRDGGQRRRRTQTKLRSLPSGPAARLPTGHARHRPRPRPYRGTGRAAGGAAENRGATDAPGPTLWTLLGSSSQA